jgi:hypothetical protein
MDRLSKAWEALEALSRNERAQFMRMLADWQEQHGRGRRPPLAKVQELADALDKVAL